MSLQDLRKTSTAHDAHVYVPNISPSTSEQKFELRLLELDSTMTILVSSQLIALGMVKFIAKHLATARDVPD
jgi:hypothetical protein